MATYSDVLICNMALDMVGAENISALTDADREGVVADRYYAQARDHSLEALDWSFASVRRAVANTGTAPLGNEWDYEYPLPSDPWCLAIRELIDEDQATDYRVEGRSILINLDSLSIRYTGRVHDEAHFSAHFVNILSLELAADFAMALKGSRTQRQSFLQEYRIALNDAQGFDSEIHRPVLREPLLADAGRG